MKFYAENAARRTRQLIADGLFLVWCALWVCLGNAVRSSFDGAQDGARRLESSGGDLARRMDDVGHAASGVSFIGDLLQEPFTKAADAARSIGGAGHDLSDGLGQLALLLSALTAFVPIFFALVPWVWARLRYARRAGRVAQLRRLPGGEKLLALEALTSSTPRVLASISPDPAGQWQAGDVEVTARLAREALESVGLRPQAVRSTEPA